MATSKKNVALTKIAATRSMARASNVLLTLKSVEFIDPSRQALMNLGTEATQLLGAELSLVQLGEAPTDFKPMPSIGPGVCEIRAQTGRHWIRLFYVASFPDAIYVLDAIRKTQNKTEQVDIDRVKARYKKAVELSKASLASDSPVTNAILRKPASASNVKAHVGARKGK
jgi:phage-related protein